MLAIFSTVLGGLMVMPTVFAFGLDPNAGSGLTFVTMTAIFAQLPAGQFFAVAFYLCLVFAALTSNVGMPLSAMGFLIAVAWVAWKKHTVRQLQTVRTLTPFELGTIRFFMGILAPLMILIVVATNI